MNLSCSIALATYNGEKYIQKQLQSILNQTHKLDQVIIFDDCSTDNTPEIIYSFIKEHSLHNWEFNTQPKNCGYIENFKSAVSHCSSDIIFLCDQDDIWASDKVKLMMNVFSNNVSVKSLLCGFKLVDSNDNILTNKKTIDNVWFHDFENIINTDPHLFKANLSSVLNHNIGPGCTQAFRRELVNSFLNFDYKLPHDYKISLLAALVDGLYFYNIPLVHYRMHNNNEIGVPGFYLARATRKYHKIPLYYLYLLSRFILLIFNSKKISLSYDKSELIKQLDSLPLCKTLLQEYNEWKEFCEIRKKLYSPNKNKNKYRKIQHKKYKKFYKSISYTNDNIENFNIWLNDIAVLLKH